jgi:molecular chaperone GrpE
VTDHEHTTTTDPPDEVAESGDPSTDEATTGADPDVPAPEAADAVADDHALAEEEQPDWTQRAEEDGRSPGQLLEALTEAQADRDDYLDALQRSRAEFDNFRRRSAREAAGARQAGVGDLATQLLDVIDDLDRTVTVAEDSSDEGLAAGISAVRRKLVDVLLAAGVERIDQSDVPFDARRHEAVQQVPADEPVAEPEVAQVLRPGYVHGDRVLRAAMVTVRQ